MTLLDLPLLPCAYKLLFGISCPMCGFQRSLLLLVQGRVGDSIMMFPPLVVMALAVAYFAVLRLRHKSLKGHLWVWILLAAVFTFNFFYQNLV